MTIDIQKQSDTLSHIRVELRFEKDGIEYYNFTYCPAHKGNDYILDAIEELLELKDYTEKMIME